MIKRRKEMKRTEIKRKTSISRGSVGLPRGPVKRRKQVVRIRPLRFDDPVPTVTPRSYRSQHGYIELRWKVGVDEYVREYEHRIAAGRPHPRFHVHHINGIKDDNRPENLQVLTPSEHSKLHVNQDAERRTSGGMSAETERMKELYESGMGTKDIGPIVGLNPATVYRRLASAGVQFRAVGAYRAAEIDADEAVAMYATGVGIKRVAKALGTSVAKVRQALKSRGVPSRRPGRPAKVVGVTSARDLVRNRSGGTCERCGSAPAAEWHHRKNRSQGGLWQAVNGLHLCPPCHRHVTESPTESYANGWSVRSTVDPQAVPVWRRGAYVWLTADGSFEPLDMTEIAEWVA